MEIDCLNVLNTFQIEQKKDFVFCLMDLDGNKFKIGQTYQHVDGGLAEATVQNKMFKFLIVRLAYLKNVDQHNINISRSLLKLKLQFMIVGHEPNSV